MENSRFSKAGSSLNLILILINNNYTSISRRWYHLYDLLLPFYLLEPKSFSVIVGLPHPHLAPSIIIVLHQWTNSCGDLREIYGQKFYLLCVHLAPFSWICICYLLQLTSCTTPLNICIFNAFVFWICWALSYHVTCYSKLSGM